MIIKRKFMLKFCKGCGDIKHRSYYNKERDCINGLSARCKECVKAKVKSTELFEFTSVNKDTAYRAEYEKRNGINKRRKHGDRVKARKAVWNAIKGGRLHRLSCEVCGEEQAHAHHDDYNNPLDVRWLCRSCHLDHHRCIGVI